MPVAGKGTRAPGAVEVRGSGDIGSATYEADARRARGDGVSFKEKSLGHKLSPVRYEPYRHPASGRLFQRPFARAPFVSATFASIAATCPTECPLRGAGCYAQNGFHAPAMRLLDASAAGASGVDVARAEARAIRGAFGGGRVPQDGARGGRDLRLHISGDVPSEGTALAASALAAAAWSWRVRGGGAVWTYTHQWRRVRRDAWGAIAVLASCDDPGEVRQARRQGYAAALVVAEFPSDRAFRVPGVPGKVVPCPAQTRETTCAECRLCLDRDLLELDVTIGFAAHGTSAGRIRARAWSPTSPVRRLAVLG